jgi:hypothetical protein
MCVLISLAVITAKSSKLVQESKQQLRGDEQTLEGGAEKVNQRQPPHRGGIPGARKMKSRPKGAMAPYMYFCKDQREYVMNENPNMSFGDVGRILGSQWQNMSEKQKMVQFSII